jgi:hypothetical protein
MSEQLKADIRKILSQGKDPLGFRRSLAALRGVTVEDVDAAIAAVGGTPAAIDPEVVAQNRLREQRALRGTSAYKQANHEED